jgi:hypothetical protein
MRASTAAATPCSPSLGSPELELHGGGRPTRWGYGAWEEEKVGGGQEGGAAPPGTGEEHTWGLEGDSRGDGARRLGLGECTSRVFTVGVTFIWTR